MMSDITGKNARTGSTNHPLSGVVTKARFSQHGTNIFANDKLSGKLAHNVLVTSGVNNNGVTELFALLHGPEKKKAHPLLISIGSQMSNDDGDTQIRINGCCVEGCRAVHNNKIMRLNRFAVFHFPNSFRFLEISRRSLEG